jgi:hypothetical protein
LYTSSFWYFPTGQWSQLVCADVAAILPASHCEHSSPVLAWYLPSGQSSQYRLLISEKRPLAHVVQLSALYRLL